MHIVRNRNLQSRSFAIVHLRGLCGLRYVALIRIPREPANGSHLGARHWAMVALNDTLAIDATRSGWVNSDATSANNTASAILSVWSSGTHEEDSFVSFSLSSIPRSSGRRAHFVLDITLLTLLLM